MKRGRETAHHIALKEEASRALSSEGWISLPEHLNCDICAINPATGEVLCVEIERSPRNLENNLKRNIRQGATSIAIIAPLSSLYSFQTRIDAFDASIPVNLFRDVRAFANWLHNSSKTKGGE